MQIEPVALSSHLGNMKATQVILDETPVSSPTRTENEERRNSTNFGDGQQIESEYSSFTSLLPDLTLEEKVGLLSGRDFVHSNGVSRLNIPSLKLVDSINGVKGSDLHHGVSTAIFPSSTLYGATWNNSLMEELGKCLAHQAKLKSAQVILGPTINIHRDPRAGRNFECFSEDPLLSGQLAAAIVRGIQSQDVASCPKHFACNESEFKRRQYSVTESHDSRTAREIYFAAFQEMLRTSEPDALMVSYNKLGGIHTTEHTFLQQILRDEWAYNGCLVSDWFATKSCIDSINAGLDLEMPGPSVFRGNQLVNAVKDGLVDEDTIDKSVSRVLTLIERSKDSHSQASEKSELDPLVNALALRVASEGIVLLKNEAEALPLDMRRAPSIAVVGLPASEPVISGGGSASAPPQYLQKPLDCLRQAHPMPSLVRYAHGVKTNRIVPTVPLDCSTSMNGTPGFNLAYFNHNSDIPIFTENSMVPTVSMVRNLKPGLQEPGFRYQILTNITPKTTGSHTLAARVTGSFSLYVDECLVLSIPRQADVTMEDFLFEPFRLEHRTTFAMQAGKSYSVRLVVQARIPRENDYEPTPHGGTLCFQEFEDERESISNAVQLASTSDVSIIFAGRNQEYESEGFDLDSMSISDSQIKLIRAVTAVSKKTVLVLNCGNPIDVSPFIDGVDAVLNAHFPGQEGGQAVTDILTGKTNPSGRLATTWPRRLDPEHVPTYHYFPAQLTDHGYEIDYAEGIQVGYRHPKSSQTAQWSFGHGLSYSTFEYDGLTVESKTDKHEACGSSIIVSVSVKNTGMYPGHEVVQVYVMPPENSTVWRPKRELKAYAKVWLLPQQSETVSFSLTEKHALSYWDESVKKWRLEQGTYQIAVEDLLTDFVVQSGFTWTGR